MNFLPLPVKKDAVEYTLPIHSPSHLPCPKMGQYNHLDISLLVMLKRNYGGYPMNNLTTEFPEIVFRFFHFNTENNTQYFL